MEETLQDNFEWVLDGFDFEKVHRVMTFLDWKWLSLDEHEVPTIEQMKKTCWELFDDVSKKGTVSCSCGGFKVSKIEVDSVEKIELEFILTSESSEYM